MNKKEKALIIIEKLKKEYPVDECTLDYDEAWKLLVSVRLAAQCTDKRVNEIMPLLLSRYPSIEALANAKVEDVLEIIKPCGLGNSKARDIVLCMKKLKEDFNCVVPKTMKELLSLPGVGRKSANLVLGDVYGLPAIVTDTHCIRLVNRMGLVCDEKNPAKVEALLWKIIPKEEGNSFCHRLVMHGREICTARTKPFCGKCCLQDVCSKRID